MEVTMDGTAKRPGSAIAAQRQAADLLELFYPVHYKSNMALEDAMRGHLTRKQAAIMWLIRSEGMNGHGMRRKDIERLLQDWFDVSSPAITKALRAMAGPPLDLVRMIEAADSGREKRIFLTPKGERFLLKMVERGRSFLLRLLAQLAERLSEREVDYGIRFLREGIAASERISAQQPFGRKKRRAANHLPLKTASRFARKAPIPSVRSSVP
jgi:DNA-binding MarR family transcriptional regulator